MMLRGSGLRRGAWFAVQVWAGREQLTARHLRQRGYDVFLPCYRERRQWSDRVKTVERALFEGYVFCRFDTDAVESMVTAPGVVRIVGNHAGPLSVPDHEVDTLKRIVETRLVAEPWPFLQVGQRVRVDVGPLRGTEGIVLATRTHRRLIVSIELLQRSVAVQIESSWVNIPHAALLDDMAG
jgi:transcription antitermination factor NusG